jgi:hypothetical protein
MARLPASAESAISLLIVEPQLVHVVEDRRVRETVRERGVRAPLQVLYLANPGDEPRAVDGDLDHSNDGQLAVA